MCTIREWAMGGFHVSFYPFETDRLCTTSCTYVCLVHSRSRTTPHGRPFSSCSSFCQFLSFSFSRECLSQPTSIQARIPRDRRAGRRIRVQPFLFDAALGTAGVKTCLCIATTIQHRTYKAAA